METLWSERCLMGRGKLFLVTLFHSAPALLPLLYQVCSGNRDGAMSDTYVTMKVKEALRSGYGSRSQAMRLLVAMALTDEQLLRGLCKPFLPAICGSAVDRVARGQVATQQSATRATAAKPAAKRKLTPQMLDAIINRMGQGTPAPGPAAPGPAIGLDFGDDSPQQADSLKALAAAFKQR